jgi:chromate reductase
MFKVAVIVGSLRKESFNRKLALALDNLKHPHLQFDILQLDEVPVFNQDNEKNLPAAVVNFKTAVSNADAVLFVTPEYNRSIPGVLKNIIDWGTRPYGQNCWENKPTAIIGTSQSSVGTAIAQSHLRSIMTVLGGILLSQPEVYLVYKTDLIDEKQAITDESTKKFLLAFLESFSNWIKKQTEKK